ncbi:class I SAM-dependent methyltransferase [Arthrobacter sp.]|uniref:class I SAM-dependent methyltransferase n=1 Tax=Arthrobacter sp. TaxID=1667 RepID=UPI003A93C7C0
MADEIFTSPRLAVLYDALDPDRDDLDAYLDMVGEFGARSVLDVGCGTGTLACLLADRGLEVVGVDPAGASLAVARGKPGAERVRWIHGTAESLPVLSVELAVMTANVAQVFLTDEDFVSTLRAIRRALAPHGLLVFEVRDPSRRAWLGWNREETFSSTSIDGVGDVEAWCDLLDVQGELVSFRWTHHFTGRGESATSDSTLRFRSRESVAACVGTAGFALQEVRGAPDRPGREMVFIVSAGTGRVP